MFGDANLNSNSNKIHIKYLFSPLNSINVLLQESGIPSCLNVGSNKDVLRLQVWYKSQPSKEKIISGKFSLVNLPSLTHLIIKFSVSSISFDLLEKSINGIFL